MDKEHFVSALNQALGEAVPSQALDRFRTYVLELRRFGEKLNLTAIQDEEAIVDKHFADSLLASRAVPTGRLLDVGTGAGFPGVPLAIVRPDLRVTLVDSSKKRVGFLKALLATLDLSNADAVHARLGAPPTLGQFDAAIARAFAELGEWLELGRHHVRPGGRVVAMLAKAPSEAELATAGEKVGLRLAGRDATRLPLSGDPRTLAWFEKG